MESRVRNPRILHLLRCPRKIKLYAIVFSNKLTFCLSFSAINDEDLFIFIVKIHFIGKNNADHLDFMLLFIQAYLANSLITRLSFVPSYFAYNM